MDDLFLRECRVVPNGEVGDLLVRAGVIAEVGPSLTRPPGVELVEAEGRWLVPGLWDQHVHLGQWVAASQRLDLSAAVTPADVVRRVGERLATNPPRAGRVLAGHGHRSGTWDREVTVAELDAVVGDVPVVLVSGDAHHAWVSSAGLRALGLAPRPDVVQENEWFDAYPRLAALVDEDESPAAFRRAVADAASRGVVGLVDFEFGGTSEAWRERWSQGCDLVRVRWASYDLAGAVGPTGTPLDTSLGDPRLTMGPLKIVSDGSLNTRTAWCCDPYSDGDRLDHPAGLPNLSVDELSSLLAGAVAAGLETAVHAIGDAALDAALTAYERTGARGSIEHVQLARLDDVRRMARLPLRASVQPAHLLDDRDVTEQVWPGRADRCFAWRWLVDAGVPLAFGSDAPVSPLDPWLAMAAAVHRSADARGPWHPEQALTPSEALAASVDGRRIAVGEPGDLVLLEADPLAVHGDSAAAGAHLLGMPVALTVMAGRITHHR